MSEYVDPSTKQLFYVVKEGGSGKVLLETASHAVLSEYLSTCPPELKTSLNIVTETRYNGKQILLG